MGGLHPQNLIFQKLVKNYLKMGSASTKFDFSQTAPTITLYLIIKKI